MRLTPVTVSAAPVCAVPSAGPIHASSQRPAACTELDGLVEALLEQLQGGRPASRQLPTELVVRDSTA